MIAKGGARSGPKQLAVYLMRVDQYDTGEPAELLELRSPWATAPNGTQERSAAKLIEAFRDWQTLAEGTKQGEYGLYHAQISPAPQYAKRMTPEQWKRAADILGEELGLQGQDRALVLHAGTKDRPHLHVVWGRCDIDQMKLVSDSYNYPAHERASQRMELEFGQEFVPGKHAKRDREAQPEFPRAKMNEAEAQQAARLGMTKEERIEQLAQIRENCDDGLAFKNALEDAGYVLAKGDRRGFVLVDEQGETFSLSKHLPDLKGKEYKAFMAPVDAETLPTVEEAKARQEQAAEARKEEARKAPAPEAPAEAKQQGAEASKFLPGQPPQPTEQPAPASPEPEKQPAQAEAPKPYESSKYVRKPDAPEAEKPKAEDPEIIALKKAIAEREQFEAKQLADRQAEELRQKDAELTDYNTRKAKDFERTLAKEARALRARQKEKRPGWKGVADDIKLKLSPALKAAKAEAQRFEREQLHQRQEQDRARMRALLEEAKKVELENLRSRHELERSDQAKKHEEEAGRLIREQHEAKRILAELEAKRIHEELEKQKNEDLKKGPPPPGMGK